MADTITQDAPAESSPAPLEVPTDGQAYAEWRMSGKLPAAPAPAATPKKEAPAASQEHSAAGEQPTGKGAPASEAGKPPQERKRSDAAARLDEILADLKTAGFTPAELKTFRREAKQQEQQPAAAPPAKAATEQTAKPAGELKAPEKPKLETFQGTYEEYQAALDKYHEDMTEFKIQQALGNDRQQRAHEAAQREIEAKLSEAKKRYGDEAQPTIVKAAKLLHNDAAVPPVIKAMLNDSAAPVDLLYVLGSKPEELAEFIALAKSNPGQAIRKLAVVENLVIEELAKGGGKSAEAGEGTPARDPDGKFTPAKQTTKAPPPSKEAGGRSGAPADPVESAAGAGDFRAFREAANRRDLAHRRGQ